MGAQKKFQNNYPLEDNKRTQGKETIEDKKLIQAYIKKIGDLLKDPKSQKKAAEILSQMINSKK